jgi:tRNA wybutosine-synthesizing protein 3
MATTTLPQSFVSKKSKILSVLSIPDTDYDDLSPKGSLDAPIRDLIDEINAIEGLVTTSSCSGRVSVFLEGVRKANDGEGVVDEDAAADVDVPGRLGEAQTKLTVAKTGGKGGGGRWLYVSHDPVEMEAVGSDVVRFLGMEAAEESSSSHSGERRIHFKFEGFVSDLSSRHSNSELRRDIPFSLYTQQYPLLIFRKIDISRGLGLY